MIISEKAIYNFWKKVTITESCWIWNGCKFNTGYGKLKLNGKHYRAHRVSYVIENGSIPTDKMICHRCNNKLCVNPSHLYAGTAKDNCVDSILSGTHSSLFYSKGEDNGNSKLCLSDIEIIKELAKSGKTQKEISKLFNVCRQNISNILLGKSWNY